MLILILLLVFIMIIIIFITITSVDIITTTFTLHLIFAIILLLYNIIFSFSYLYTNLSRFPAVFLNSLSPFSFHFHFFTFFHFTVHLPFHLTCIQLQHPLSTYWTITQMQDQWRVNYNAFAALPHISCHTPISVLELLPFYVLSILTRGPIYWLRCKVFLVSANFAFSL